jgi:glyoxylate/hydroxypyruvate reductase
VVGAKRRTRYGARQAGLRADARQNVLSVNANIPARVKILFASETEKAEFWVPLLEQALPNDRFVSEAGNDVDIAIVATPPAGTLARLSRAKLIQSLWMGVEKLLADPGLPKGVPIARLIDPGMVAAMSESVLAHVLDWHRHHYRYRAQQAERQWRRRKQYLACDRTVGLLGLGELGSDAAKKLLALGFNVAGYSRRPKQISGVQSFTELAPMLRVTDALVCLLPLTPQTRGMLNLSLFRRLARDGVFGAPALMNAGRGGLQVEADILAALDEGILGAATLDVFETEPLPPSSRLWGHPRVTVTPHNSAISDEDAVGRFVLRQIDRHERGLPFETPVDRDRRY